MIQSKFNLFKRLTKKWINLRLKQTFLKKIATVQMSISNTASTKFKKVTTTKPPLLITSALDKSSIKLSIIKTIINQMTEAPKI